MKKIIIPFLIVVLLLLFVSCEQGQSTDNGDNKTPNTNQTETEGGSSPSEKNPSTDESTPVTPPSGENESTSTHVHKFSYGKCTSCDITPVNTWDISKNGDGSLKAHLYAVNSNYTLEIAGEGDMLEQEYNEYMPWRENRNKITEICFNGSLTRISRQAFNGLAITSLELPKTVQYIGEEAFSACTNLVSITIPQSVIQIDQQAFFMCSKLQIVDISLSTEMIGNNAFQYCPELTTITFGKNTTSAAKTLTIGNGAFSSCSKLVNFVLPNHTIQIGVDAFKDVPDSIFTYESDLAYLGDWLIKPRMANIQSVIIKNSCFGIADGALEDCDNIKTVTVPSSVTMLGAFVFRNCDQLESVSLPISITEIKNGVFYGCKNLKDVNIPKYTTRIGTHAFYDCNSLEGIIIPVEVQDIGTSAFYGCDSLEQLAIISQNIRNIGSHCFYDCSELKYVSYPATQEHWEQMTIGQGNSTLEKANILFNVSANHLHTIVEMDEVEPTCYSKGFTASAYCSECALVLMEKEDLGTLDHEYDANDICSCGQKKPTEGLIFEITYYNSAYKVMGITDASVTDVVIPKYYEGLPVIEIDYEAFKGNRKIRTVYLPSTIKIIGQSAFEGCNNLESITLSEGLEIIGNFAFSDCDDLMTINLPSTLKEIRAFAFVDCTSLDDITLPSGLEVLGAAAFQKCESLKKISIPQNIRGIESNTFAFCYSLSVVELHSDISYLDEQAFYCCKTITEFSLPSSVEWIGASCFSYCDELSKVELNDKLEEIDQGAFQGCEKLTTMKFSGSIELWNRVELDKNWIKGTNITQIECIDGNIAVLDQ